jgi:hypothetical protein
VEAVANFRYHVAMTKPTSAVDLIVRLEWLALLVVMCYAVSARDSSWLYFLLGFFAPDLGMLGYILSPKIGAFTYNILHNLAVAFPIALIGVFDQNETLFLIGAVLIAHISFDRMLGYGLKYADGFRHTHLGMLPKP